MLRPAADLFELFCSLAGLKEGGRGESLWSVPVSGAENACEAGDFLCTALVLRTGSAPERRVDEDGINEGLNCGGRAELSELEPSFIESSLVVILPA